MNYYVAWLREGVWFFMNQEQFPSLFGFHERRFVAMDRDKAEAVCDYVRESHYYRSYRVMSEDELCMLEVMST